MKLQIAENFSLPPEAVTQTFAVLGMRGSGKSNSGVVMAEEMYDAGLHWVAIDPKGDWYGIRSSADGKKAGLPVVIFGGEHADLPIEADSGASLADLIVDQRITCVVDVSGFTEGEKVRFLAGSGKQDGFAARLYRRKSNSQPPTHIFFEEADDYLPQRFGADKAKLLHDCGRLLLWGRQHGIGGSALSQRSARVNKDILTQCDTLIVMRTTGSQDRDAILEWVKYHGLAKDLIASLSSLENGEAWIWSPHALKTMEKIRFRRRRTFDSGATPKVGGVQLRPATLADVNLGAIEKLMASTIEKAKSEDPRELQKLLRLRDVEISKLKAAMPTANPGVLEHARAEGRKEGERASREFVAKVLRVAADATAALRKVNSEVNRVTGALSAFEDIPVIERIYPAPIVHPVAAVTQAVVTSNGNGSGSLGRCELAVLRVLAQFPEGCTKEKLALLAGYRYSGGFRNALGALRGYGYMTGGNEEIMRITDAGASAAGDFDPLPTGRDLARYWLSHHSLGKAERAVLTVLLAHPRGLTGPEIAPRCDPPYEYSGGFRNALGCLRTAGLIVGDKNTEPVRASEELF